MTFLIANYMNFLILVFKGAESFIIECILCVMHVLREREREIFTMKKLFEYIEVVSYLFLKTSINYEPPWSEQNLALKTVLLVFVVKALDTSCL